MAHHRKTFLPPTILMSVRQHKAIQRTYQDLYHRYGPQHWWPGDTPFEIMVGAILTQNTAWTNVEKAIHNLKQAGCLDPESIVSMPIHSLAELIRPSGYFNVKAGRLTHYCQWYLENGGYEQLKALKTQFLRQRLLSVHGVGPETADDILLYGFRRRVFVVDAYTRRLFLRLGIIEGEEDYDGVRVLAEQALKRSVKDMNELHALIVIHAKNSCRVRPLCETCCIRRRCRFQADQAANS